LIVNFDCQTAVFTFRALTSAPLVLKKPGRAGVGGSTTGFPEDLGEKAFNLFYGYFSVSQMRDPEDGRYSFPARSAGV
jgi:hypothetical protein